MAKAYIGLGANLGDPEASLRAALAALAEHPAVRVSGVSAFHRTRPVGPPQPDFLNAVARVESDLPPHGLLDALQRIERRLGRRPARRWAPRVIDLDLLLYDELVVADDDLVVPHPLMEARRFVLVPLAEIAPDVRHPVLGKTPVELLADLERRLARGGPRNDVYVAVAGPIGAGKTTLALRLAGRMHLMPLLEACGAQRLLERFYADRQAHALTTQLWFLVRRARQMLEVAGDRPRRIVSDYLFEKDRVFCALNLRDGERRIYEAARALYADDLPRPDLVIYLVGDARALLSRVRARRRPGEDNLGEDYLAAVHEQYERLFSGDVGAPVLRIAPEMAEGRFAENGAAFERLVAAVAERLPAERWCADPPDAPSGSDAL